MTIDAAGLPPIDRAIVDAVLSGRIAAGTRLGEQALADIFSVSRTVVREALIRLETRGIVQVIPRRGWFVLLVSLEEAREAFVARVAVETGILRSAHAAAPGLIPKLRGLIAQERAAIGLGDLDLRRYLANTFHILLAEGLGNRVLAEIVRDLIARTVPISALQALAPRAHVSIDEHEAITDAVGAGAFEQAAALMSPHLRHSESELAESSVAPSVLPDRPFDLRGALQSKTISV